MKTLKQIITIAKKMRKDQPGRFDKWTDYVREASKQTGGLSGYHKDNKSHNVNIKVLSGLKINRKKVKLGALPVEFSGNILGMKFKVYNQYNLDGSVILQIVENKPDGELIINISGTIGEIDQLTEKFYNKIPEKFKENLYNEKDIKTIKKKIKDFITQLHKEVRAFNTGKDTRTKKVKKLNIEAKKSNKVNKGTKEQIKDILRMDKKRLKYGYTIVPGKVLSGVNMFQELDKLEKQLKHYEIMKEFYVKALKNKQISSVSKNQQRNNYRYAVAKIKNINRAIKDQKRLIKTSLK